MSAGGLSYSGLRTQAKVTLPSVDSWGTNMNIIKRPPRNVQTRRIDKVGDTQNILLEQDDSGDRIAEVIKIYPRGVNPMVSVSYDNASNNSGALKANIAGIGQASLPYKLQNFRPPVFRQEDLLPLSRLPRVWNSAETNPQFPNFKNETTCSGMKKSIVEENKLLHIHVDPHSIDNTRPTITDDAVRELPSHSILPETVLVTAQTQKSQSDCHRPSIPEMIPSSETPQKCIVPEHERPTTIFYETPRGSDMIQKDQSHTLDEHEIQHTAKPIDRKKQIYEAFSFLKAPYALTQQEGWSDLKKTVKENLLWMNARTNPSQPSQGSTILHDWKEWESLPSAISSDVLHSFAPTLPVVPSFSTGIDQTFGSSVDASRKCPPKVMATDIETQKQAPHSSFSLDPFVSSNQYDSRIGKIDRDVMDVSTRHQQEKQGENPLDITTSLRSCPRLPLSSLETQKGNSENRKEWRPSDFYEFSSSPSSSTSLPSNIPIHETISTIEMETMKTRDTATPLINQSYDRLGQSKCFVKDTSTQKTYLSQSHPYAQSEMTEHKFQKNLPLYQSSTNENGRGEQDFKNSHVTIRPSRLVTTGEHESASSYTGMYSEGSMPSRNVSHRMSSGKCLPKEGFLHNRRGVNFFETQQKQTDVALGPTVNDWSQTKQRASLAMQERFRL